MSITKTKFANFLNRYKRLRIVSTVNEKTGNRDWCAFNYRNTKVMNYSGSKSSILLVNSIHVVNSRDKEWLEKALIEAAGENVVQG